MSTLLAVHAAAALSAAYALDPDDAIYQNPNFARGLREDVALIRHNAMEAGVPVSHLEWVDGKEFLVTLGKGGVTLGRREIEPVDFGPVAAQALEGLNRRRASRLQHA